MNLSTHFFAGRKKRSSDFFNLLRSGLLRSPRRPVFPRRPVGVVPRTINPEVRECMSRCGDCALFLMPYEDMIIDGKKVDFFNTVYREVSLKVLDPDQMQHTSAFCQGLHCLKR